MDYDAYGSSAVELAIDLANAELDPPDGVVAFLTAHDEWFTPGTSFQLSPGETAQAAKTARLIRDVAVAESEDDVLSRLNQLLALARPRPYATNHDGELHLHYARPDAPALEQLTTTVAVGLSQLVVQHGWQRLGVCAAEGCGNVYVDTSRNASRRYCSNTCASRSTVAAYRARRKA
jgi:predicted RNA-binding Zn ribbon-like protein